MDKKNYDDIINMPHHVSRVHPQMPIADRAAQFAPFAALTGYEELIETAGVQNAVKDDTVVFCKDNIEIP